MTAWGMGLFPVAYNGYVCESLFPYRHPDRSGGIFLAHRYSAVCETTEKGKPFAKGARKNKVQGRFLAALEMTVWGGWITHVPYKGYVGKTPLPQRHPERSRGIFLAHRYSAVCETAGKGNPSVKGTRKNKVQGRFLAALEMTVGGNGFISRSVQRICLESAILVSSSRAKPSIFLAHRYSAVCVIAENGNASAKGNKKARKRGNLLRKEQERAECKEDFSLRSK